MKNTIGGWLRHDTIGGWLRPMARWGGFFYLCEGENKRGGGSSLDRGVGKGCFYQWLMDCFMKYVIFSQQTESVSL